MILTDREIKISLERGLIRIEPPPDLSRALSSTALDLTLDATIRTFRRNVAGMQTIIDPSEEGFNSAAVLAELTDTITIPNGGYTLQANGTFILAWTAEYVRLDVSTRLAARIEGKSSIARLGVGVHITAPTIHAGFKGQIQVEMVNHGVRPVLLRPGMPICQLIFETTLGTPDKGYQGQFSEQTAS